MTIGVGFKCVDGVVLAADSQYTDYITKIDGQKIFPIPSNGKYALTIAGAGHVGHIAKTVKEIAQAMKVGIGTHTPMMSEIEPLIEDALCRVYARHVDPAPKDQWSDLDFGLLIGIWTQQEGSKLFNSARTTVNQSPDHLSVGMGSYLVEYLTGVFLPPGTNVYVQEATALAPYIVWAAKKYVDSCGGTTFVRALLDDGTDLRISKEEVQGGEDYFKTLLRDVSRVRSFLGNTFKPEDIDMTPYARLLRARVIKFRKTQEKQKALRSKRQRATRRLT